MKNLLVAIGISLVITACGSKTKTNNEEGASPEMQIEMNAMSIKAGDTTYNLNIPKNYSVVTTNGTNYSTTKSGKVLEIAQFANINNNNNYDFQMEFSDEPVDVKSKYKEREDWATESGNQTGLEIVKQEENFIIYKGMDGKVPFHSIIIAREIGGRYLVTDTEQVHYTEDMKPITLSYEDCLVIVQIYNSIKL